MKKKLQLVSILFLLLTSVLSAQSFTVGNFNYTVFAGTNVSLTGYVTKPTGSLTIPSAVTNAGITYAVTSIGDYSFSNCIGLTHVNIPNSVTTIGNNVFDSCSGLVSVSISDSVTSIGNFAFTLCTSLTSVIIPNSVASIGHYVFSYCFGLKSVYISNSVDSIKAYSFYSCTSLTSVTIPNSVTSFGYNAFQDCTGLKSVDVSWAIPLVITSDVFSNIPLNTVDLNVPTGTTALYQAANVWKNFKFPTLSTNNFFLDGKVKLYPNPVKDSLIISGLDQKENYSIYSFSGVKISAGSVDAVNQVISTQNLANGTYFIQLGQGSSMKFVKQ